MASLTSAIDKQASDVRAMVREGDVLVGRTIEQVSPSFRRPNPHDATVRVEIGNRIGNRSVDVVYPVRDFGFDSVEAFVEQVRSLVHGRGVRYQEHCIRAYGDGL